MGPGVVHEIERRERGVAGIDAHLLQAGREPKLLSRNPIGERSMASPAISNGQIFIRTDGSLLCFGKS